MSTKSGGFEASATLYRSLHASRPFLVELLEAGAVPHRKVGTHRRVRFEYLLRYKQADDAKRQHVLDQLAAQAQELGLGY